MLELKIKKADITFAQAEAKKMGALKNSFTKGKGNVIGILGEKLISDLIGAEKTESFDFDLAKKDKDGKVLKLEIKTKKCTSPPKPDYFCSISKYSKHQTCDYYLFLRILEDLSRAWFVGYISQKEFYEKAIFYKKGDLDPNSNLGWTFREDCYNLKISELKNYYIKLPSDAMDFICKATAYLNYVEDFKDETLNKKVKDRIIKSGEKLLDKYDFEIGDEL